MNQGSTLFLKVAVSFIGFMVLILSLFWLPWLANEAAALAPELAHLQYPVLIGMYITLIPFLFALYHALKLLRCIDFNIAFSELSVRSLYYIKYCSFSIIGCIFLMAQNALHPGIALIGFIIIFTSVVIAVFSAVLQYLLKQAIDIKSENELMV
ncbi:DUF2975 domain-containing protein [Virgibacillus oceani]|uniref:Membrane protein YoaS n=1 Tax=Virgibacillus oceani TaxID=1479511 RepID=A0A917HSJ8_9BACI|nr:DUF2975 domain-containing protein [Virgibacillus oceani]GGG87970.1 putative membrane protein YoaS [Virgibacillus oceani]